MCTVKIPLPIAGSSCPFAARSMANGLRGGLESCTWVRRFMCFSWKSTWEAPVSTIRWFGGECVMVDDKASALVVVCLLAVVGRFQNVPPPKSLPFLRLLAAVGRDACVCLSSSSSHLALYVLALAQDFARAIVSLS